MKRPVILGLLITASILLAACPAPEPKIQTIVQTVVVKETVVETVEVVQTVVQEKIVEVTPTPKGGPKATVRRDLGYDPLSLDPSLATDSVSTDVIQNLFLGLTSFDGQGNVEPEIVRDWDVSEDGLVYTFNMRDDVRWVSYTPSGGVVEIGPVTADDIVYGVKRACNPDMKADETYAYVDYIIKGCEDWNTADAAALSTEELQALADTVGITAVDSYTVQFELTTPAAYFPAIAGMPVNRPQPRATIDQYGDTWTEAGKIVTNGPYYLASWFHNDSLILEKNPYWYGWADALGNIDRVELPIITDPSTALAQYAAGELDTTTVPLPEIERVRNDSLLGNELTITPDACTYYYGFTAIKPPVDNVLVRKALSAVIDRKSLVENVLKGGQIPANTFAPSMIFGNAAEDTDIAPWALTEAQGGTGYAAAVELAKSWLAEAGYPNGEGFPPISIVYNTSDANAQIAQAIQTMWRETLGIEVNVETQEWRGYLDTIGGDTPLEERSHVYRMAWCAFGYADENSWVHEVFNSDAGYNDNSWEAVATAPLGPDGASFNELTQSATLSQNPEERKALYRAAEKILTEDGAGIAPIYYYAVANVTKPYLKRTFFSVDGQRFETWVLDEAAKMDATGM